MSNVTSMYIHIPFCKSICSYCDFTKMIYDHKYEDKYIDCLIKEIKDSNPNKCKTIYLGGGTPSVLTAKSLDKLLSFLTGYLTSDNEFTIEVNPETVDEEKVKLFKKYGINRVSIGVESFDDDILKILNRNHSASDVKECVRLLNEYDIDNYSFDFIYGVRGSTLDHLANDFKYIDELKPKHLSFYSLILEDHTCLKVNGYQEEDEDKVVEEYEYIYKELEKRNYLQYEVSNYAYTGYESKHNLVYWRAEEYYGFGLGASGYVDGVRYTNTKNLTRYLKNDYDRETETLSESEQKLEFLMLGLRLNKGISLNDYKSKFGEDILNSKKEIIDKYIKRDLLKISNDRLFTTHKGMLLLDMVVVDLI